jgi:hypothetical protein
LSTAVDVKVVERLTTPDGVVVELVDVSPELAAQWLKRNSRNRALSTRTVAGYVRDVEADDWPFTGDPIRFAKDGTLLDGQHRLTAVVDTGISMSMLVISGLGEHTQRYMDGGRKRTASDQLAMDKVPNYTAIASIARIMILWNPKGFWDSAAGCQIVRGARVPTVPEVLEFVEQFPAIHDAAKQGMWVQSRLRGAKGSAVGAAYMRAQKLDSDDAVFDAANWFHKLGTGEELSAGHPLLALRRSIVRAKEGDTHSVGNAQAPLLYKIVRTWNASRDGDTLEKILLPKGGLTSFNFPDMR